MAKRKFSFTLDSELHARYKEACEERCLSMSKKVNKLIEEDLRRMYGEV